MNESSAVLEDLDASGVEEAAALLAAAFLNSPAYAYIYEHLVEDHRLEALKWLFSSNLAMVLEKANCKCVYQNGEMVCFFLLQPPDAEKIGWWDMVTHGVLTIPFRFGWKAFARLLQVKDYHDKEYLEFFQTRAGVRKEGQAPPKYCKLERMVVRPDWQGRGIGTKYLGAAVQGMNVKGHGVVLNTQEERNVTFYSRLGFSVVSHSEDYFQVGDKKTQNTFMVQEPLTTETPENGKSNGL